MDELVWADQAKGRMFSGLRYALTKVFKNVIISNRNYY